MEMNPPWIELDDVRIEQCDNMIPLCDKHDVRGKRSLKVGLIWFGKFSHFELRAKRSAQR